MFKRKNPRPWYDNVKEWFWPSSGWGRTAQYIGHRVVRIPDTPASIAAGLAFGASISFTPFIGLHLAFSIGITWALRANLVAAAIGTLVGNPWTFPFIWAATYRLGAIVMGLRGHDNPTAGLKFSVIMDDPFTTLGPLLPTILRFSATSRRG